MGKIRHIAIRCTDTESTAAWMQAALELELVQRRDSGAIDLSDGDINVTLLPLELGRREQPAAPGVEHIGITVADDQIARQRMLANGAIELNPVGLGDVFYESKFQSPFGFVVDIGHWTGTSPIPHPAPAATDEDLVYAGE